MSRMWEIREGSTRRRRTRDTYEPEGTYEEGYEDGYEDAMREYKEERRKRY